MEYRLSITFAELGYRCDLPDRLLKVLLEAMPEAGPVISQDIETGELTAVVAFESAHPAQDLAPLTKRLSSALSRAGVGEEPTVLDVHVVAVDDFGEGPVAAAADALQTA